MGTKAGIEGAIHAFTELFKEHKSSGWGVLMINATNAIYNFNQIAALWNTRILWPRCSLHLFNIYKGWTPLVVYGATTHLYSKEWVTQGDPLAMYLYGVGTLPLIRSLKGWDQQVWYADDASACGILTLCMIGVMIYSESALLLDILVNQVNVFWLLIGCLEMKLGRFSNHSTSIL